LLLYVPLKGKPKTTINKHTDNAYDVNNNTVAYYYIHFRKITAHKLYRCT